MLPYYVIGVDPGQAADPTAVAIVEYQYERHARTTYRVTGLHRFRLGTPYTDLVDPFRDRLEQKPLRRRTNLAVDATGVGTPFIDLLRDELGPNRIYAVTITSGATVTGTNGNPHVPKRDLIGITSVILEQRRLRIAENMRDTGALIDELLAFRRTTTERGNDTYSAASGSHDDLVLALSLALWTAEHRSPPPRMYASRPQLPSDRFIPTADDYIRAGLSRLYNWG